MKNETYYLEKYLLLCDMIKNQSAELRGCFIEEDQISRVVRSTVNIFDSIVDKSKITEP
jgi:hypothetical protein